jgi:hypothetical protein
MRGHGWYGEAAECHCELSGTGRNASVDGGAKADVASGRCSVISFGGSRDGHTEPSDLDQRRDAAEASPRVGC